MIQNDIRIQDKIIKHPFMQKKLVYNFYSGTLLTNRNVVEACYGSSSQRLLFIIHQMHALASYRHAFLSRWSIFGWPTLASRWVSSLPRKNILGPPFVCQSCDMIRKLPLQLRNWSVDLSVTLKFSADFKININISKLCF